MSNFFQKKLKTNSALKKFILFNSFLLAQTANVFAYTEKFEAENYAFSAGVQTEPTTDVGGGENVGWTDVGDWMVFENIEIPVAGDYVIEYRVASNAGGGQLQFELAGGSTAFGQLALPNTGGWQTWETVQHTVTLPAGINDFAIAVVEGGFNLNWFTISSAVNPDDLDNDGVVFVSDLCPETLAGATVDINGCAFDTSKRGAYQMPYSRYEADTASHTGVFKFSNDYDPNNPATEASAQSYIELIDPNSGVDFAITSQDNGAQGVNLRFTMPDSPEGVTGLDGSLDVYINDTFAQTINLSSYHAYQYFNTENGETEPRNKPANVERMRFDEFHFLLASPLQVGDVLSFRRADDGISYYGIDFIEIESVPEPLPKPEGYISIADYSGATDRDRLYKALYAAKLNATGVYLPPGQYDFNKKIYMGSFHSTVTAIQGAGMWYTNVYFSNPEPQQGGFEVQGHQMNISHMHIDTINNKRFKETADGEIYLDASGHDVQMGYKGIRGDFADGSRLDNLWIEHFTAGIWIAHYGVNPRVTTNLAISNVRVRNTYADGINFAQGTSASIVENSNIRNVGDDALAVFSSVNTDPAYSAPMAYENVFRFNTVEHVYRAGGVGIFGGRDHKAHNILVRDGIGGTGVRFTNVFPAHEYGATGMIEAFDIDIENTGTSATLWNNKRGAIEFFARDYTNSRPDQIRNIKLKNITVKNAQRDAIRMSDGDYQNVILENITIYRAGADYSNDGAIIHTDNVTGNIQFENIKYDFAEGQAVTGDIPESSVVWGSGDESGFAPKKVALQSAWLSTVKIYDSLAGDTAKWGWPHQVPSLDQAQWFQENLHSTYVQFRNSITGELIHRTSGSDLLQASEPIDSPLAAHWRIVDAVEGGVRIQSREDEAEYIHIQGTSNNEVRFGTIFPSWASTRWNIVE